MSDEPQKPNVCMECGEYVGPESVPHQHDLVVDAPMFVVGDPPGVVRHTTRNGKGVVAALVERNRRKV